MLLHALRRLFSFNPKDRKQPKMKQHAFDIIIVGAGIGGLGAAIALAQKVFKVRILESKGGLSEFGANINVLPSAVRVLKAWGVAEAFEPLICRLMFTEIRNGFNNHLTGRFLSNVDKAAEITYGEEYVVLIINKKQSQKLRASFSDYGTCTEPIIKRRSPKHPKPTVLN